MSTKRFKQEFTVSVLKKKLKGINSWETFGSS